jgi:dTDP-4-dehydrorhamnose 3,5-epimerase-like enzyme
MNAAIYGEKNGDAVQYPEGVHNNFMVAGENNALVEGHRKIIGVMQIDSKKFKDRGGWGFEGFKGETKERVVSDAKNACFNCHGYHPEKEQINHSSLGGIKRALTQV